MTTIRPGALVVAAAAALWAGCNKSTDPPVSFLVGLRVMAIQAEPPQVDPGGVSQVTVVAFDTNASLTVDATWGRCALPPRPGEAVNPRCVTEETDPPLVPLGTGLSIAAQMPADATTATLGQPDATNGVYLPLVSRTTDGEQTVLAVYRLRLGDGAPPNANPAIATVDVVDAAGVAAPLEESTPLVVHSGDALTLSATFVPGSAQMYTGLGGATKTEVLTVDWFCTAGDLSVDRTSDTQPQTVLLLNERLPETAKIIDLFAVAHDERGGVGYTHRSLAFE